MRVGPRGSPPVPARQLWLLLLVIVGAVVGGRGTRVVGVLVDCRLVVMTEREKERENKYYVHKILQWLCECMHIHMYMYMYMM